MKADQFLQEAGFKVTPICGEDYPKEILPVVGPADYDMNRLFVCEKERVGISSIELCGATKSDESFLGELNNSPNDFPL